MFTNFALGVSTVLGTSIVLVSIYSLIFNWVSYYPRKWIAYLNNR